MFDIKVGDVDIQNSVVNTSSKSASNYRCLSAVPGYAQHRKIYSHRELLRLVARRVSDGRILALIKAWLRAPIVERDPDTGRPTITGNRRGTPQGGVISPLLANLYLNRLDWQVNDRCEQRPVLVRYADDFVILSRPGQGAELMARLKRWLEAHGLTLNETKTRLLDVREEGFKFLGFGVNWRRGKSERNYPHVEPHPKSQMKLRDKLREKREPLDALAFGGRSDSGSEPTAQRLGWVFPLCQQHAGV